MGGCGCLLFTVLCGLLEKKSIFHPGTRNITELNENYQTHACNYKVWSTVFKFLYFSKFVSSIYKRVIDTFFLLVSSFISKFHVGFYFESSQVSITDFPLVSDVVDVLL